MQMPHAALSILLLVGCSRAPEPASQNDSTPHGTAKTVPTQAPPTAPTEPRELAITTRDGKMRRIPGPAPILLSADFFHLVASRNGSIQFHEAIEDPGSARVILLATLPFVFTKEGALEPLQGIYDGLIPPGEFASLDATVAGGFSGPGDGWLTLETDPGMPFYRGLPLTYRWQAPGWQLVRERHGTFTELYSLFITRGTTIFATAYDLRLRTPEEILIETDGKHSRGARPERLVKLQGELPEPTLVAEEELRLFSAWATTPRGALYQVAFVPDPDSGEYRVELLDWAPGQTVARAVPLPDTSIATQSDAYGSLLRLTSTATGVLLSGNLRVDGFQQPIAYLAVGDPDTLTRLAIDYGGGACSGALTSAAVGPDGDYWLAIDGLLYRLDSGGTLSALSMPDLRTAVPPVDLRDWYWHPPVGWMQAGAYTVDRVREYPASVESMQRVGQDLWLRVSVPTETTDKIMAVFKTGASTAPVVLPSRERVLGEITRRSDQWFELRLLESVDSRQIAAFEADILPKLRARTEIRQIYETRGADGRAIVAVVAPDEWREAFLPFYATLLGQAPERAREPGNIVRMLMD